MKEIAINNGVPNQEHHGYEVSNFRLKYPSQFEACGSMREKYECLICDTRFLHTSLTRPIEESYEIISKTPVPIECKGDGQKSPLTKIQKPYNFRRAKINFSMDDLENPSEGDDWDSDFSLPVSKTSPRTQPRRKCQ